MLNIEGQIRYSGEPLFFNLIGLVLNWSLTVSFIKLKAAETYWKIIWQNSAVIETERRDRLVSEC